MGPTEQNDQARSDLLRRSKISPHLWAMIDDWEYRGRTLTPARTRGATREGIPLAPVLIEMKSADTTELVRAGVQFEHLFGLFYSSLVPLDKIEALADIESIEHVHIERQMKPDLKESIPEIRCNTVRNPRPPFSGTNKYTGLGVVVGIIDSGINILHPVFRIPETQNLTRIVAILDQTAASTHPSYNSTYRGAVHEMAAIEAAIAGGTQIIQPGQNDNNDHKHGTHVASIAAGNGHVAGNCSGQYTFVGVAPEAILVVVKYDFNAGLQSAIQFIADRAAVLPVGPRPAVVNMSFGNPIGPHDGTDPQDQMIDNWLAARPAGAGPVVLVASAGNQGGHHTSDTRYAGGDDSHAIGTIPAGNVAKTLHFNILASSPQSRGPGQVTTSIEVRFTAPNGVACKVTPPGNNITGGSNTAAADASTNFTEVTQTSQCQINGTVGAANARRINITITSAAAGQNQPGDWEIEFKNVGATAITYHSWIAGSQFERFTDDLSRANTIKSPGSSKSVITVGNYVKGKNEGQIADSSSRGPLLDAASTQKPDLCTPGEAITAARRDFHDGCCCDCCCDSYIELSGTSQAVPHVVGAVALMLERNPALTHAQAKSVLMDTARKDGFTGATNNNTYGNGKLDVVALLNDPRVKQGLPNVTGAEMPGFQRRESLVEQAALAGPRLPQIEQGTPLWRMLRTEEGERLYALGRDHWEEARMLVNSRKRIATVWHRNHGPLMIHHVIRAVMIPDVALPKEVEGEAVSIRAARLVTALEKHASPELRAALHTALPWVARLEGKTLMEVVGLLEARELQNA